MKQQTFGLERKLTRYTTIAKIAAFIPNLIMLGAPIIVVNIAIFQTAKKEGVLLRAKDALTINKYFLIPSAVVVKISLLPILLFAVVHFCGFIQKHRYGLHRLFRYRVVLYTECLF